MAESVDAVKCTDKSIKCEEVADQLTQLVHSLENNDGNNDQLQQSSAGDDLANALLSQSTSKENIENDGENIERLGSDQTILREGEPGKHIKNQRRRVSCKLCKNRRPTLKLRDNGQMLCDRCYIRQCAANSGPNGSRDLAKAFARISVAGKGARMICGVCRRRQSTSKPRANGEILCNHCAYNALLARSSDGSSTGLSSVNQSATNSLLSQSADDASSKSLAELVQTLSEDAVTSILAKSGIQGTPTLLPQSVEGDCQNVEDLPFMRKRRRRLPRASCESCKTRKQTLKVRENGRTICDSCARKLNLEPFTGNTTAIGNFNLKSDPEAGSKLNRVTCKACKNRKLTLKLRENGEILCDLCAGKMALPATFTEKIQVQKDPISESDLEKPASRLEKLAASGRCRVSCKICKNRKSTLKLRENGLMLCDRCHQKKSGGTALEIMAKKTKKSEKQKSEKNGPIFPPRSVRSLVVLAKKVCTLCKKPQSDVMHLGGDGETLCDQCFGSANEVSLCATGTQSGREQSIGDMTRDEFTLLMSSTIAQHMDNYYKYLNARIDEMLMPVKTDVAQLMTNCQQLEAENQKLKETVAILMQAQGEKQAKTSNFLDPDLTESLERNENDGSNHLG